VYTRTPLHACIPKFPIYLNVYRLQYSTVTWSWGLKGVVVDVGQIKQHFDGFWCVIVVIKRLLICYNTINVVLRCEDRVNPLRKKLFVSDWYRHGKQYSYSSEMNVAVLVWLGNKYLGRSYTRDICLNNNNVGQRSSQLSAHTTSRNRSCSQSCITNLCISAWLIFNSPAIFKWKALTVARFLLPKYGRFSFTCDH